MALHTMKDFYPDYRNYFGDHDILGYDLYSGNDKVGSVDDLLVDDQGKFRYMVINTGLWIFGKKVLLPIGRTRISYSDHRVYADSLSREQVEHLPEYNSAMATDYDQEERVRNIYRSPAQNTTTSTTTGKAAMGTTPVDTATPLDANYASGTTVGRQDLTYDRSNYTYERDPNLYNMSERDHQNLRLYEERLIANKTRQKTGEVIIGKHVETEQAHVSVPVEKERVIIERVNPSDAGTVVTPGADAFRDGEAVRMEVYEETPDIRKEAVVREEVRVRKEVDRDTVEADETLRRERLDVDKRGGRVEGPDNISGDRRI